MPRFKIEITAYPSIIEVEAGNIDEAEKIAQEMWETEPYHRDVEGVHTLEIDGKPFDGFAGCDGSITAPKMQYGNDEQGEYVELLWNDLSESAQKELMEFLGENGNFDVFPITRIYKGEEGQ